MGSNLTTVRCSSHVRCIESGRGHRRREQKWLTGDAIDLHRGTVNRFLSWDSQQIYIVGAPIDLNRGSPNIPLLPDNPHHSSFFDPHGRYHSKGNRGAKYTGVGKFGDFRLKSPFISETVRYRPMVAMEYVNRKSQMAVRYVSVPMTMSTPNPDFKVTV